MAESKIKIHRRDGYTVLPNEVLRDETLNLQTKGLFCMMLSFPEDWDFSVSGLAKIAGCSRDKIRAALCNLEDAGYLLREQSHGENGKFSGNIYVLNDYKKSPLTGFPSTGKPSTGKPLPENPTQINKDLIKKRTIPPIVPHEIEDAAAAYCAGDNALREALGGLLISRIKLKKPVVTLRALNGILRKLDDLSGGDRSAKIAMLDKAVVNNWLTVYPLKQDDLPLCSTAAPGHQEVFGWEA